MAKTRIPRRVIEYIQGSDAYYRPDSWPEAYTLFIKIFDQPRLANGDRSLELDDDEKAILRSYVDAFVAGAEDNTYDPDGRADLASGNAMLRRLG